MKIEMTCEVCGKNRFNLADAVKDTSIIICQECGNALGALGHIKRFVSDEVIRRASAKSA